MNQRPRIVSLCPSNTEVVCTLGLSDCLVGVDNYSDWPPAVVQPLPRLGPDLHIDMEKVSALQPDLVIASLSVPGMERVVEQLSQTGLTYIVLSPHRLEDIFRDLQAVSNALEGVAHVKDIIESCRSRVERIRLATSLINRPKLYWEWWPHPVFSPARNNWLTEVSELAGAANLFAEDEGDQVQDDGTRVIAGRPDYFLAVWTGVPQAKVPIHKILARPGWGALPAIAHKQLYVLPEGLYCRPSPRLIDGLEQLTALLHPELRQSIRLSSPESYGPVRRMDGTWAGGITPA